MSRGYVLTRLKDLRTEKNQYYGNYNFKTATHILHTFENLLGMMPDQRLRVFLISN
jgi:hypothetical protein